MVEEPGGGPRGRHSSQNLFAADFSTILHRNSVGILNGKKLARKPLPFRQGRYQNPFVTDTAAWRGIACIWVQTGGQMPEPDMSNEL